MAKSPELQKFVDEMAKTFFGPTKEGCCVTCKEPFSEKNVFTPLGWAEVKISKMCEKCFDGMFKED